MDKLEDIINGLLLGDGCITIDKNKYCRLKVTAKDKKLLEWIKSKLERWGLRCYFTFDRRNETYSLYTSHELFIRLRRRLYTKINGKTQKVVPRDLELTPTTLLFWYIGDGSLVRHPDPNRVPWIVLATNNFRKEDVEFLIQKLKELGLNFYAVKYRSGFKRGKECGYALLSKTSDATVYNFFKLIGFKPPKEIENCITGRKGRGSRIHYLKEKWPKGDEWIKIISNIPKLGLLLRFKEFRKKLGLTQKEAAKLIGVSREAIRDFENGKNNLSVTNLAKLLSSFKFFNLRVFH